MTGKLSGRIAVVTGAASGIGKGTVEKMVEYGADVIAADIQDDLGSALEQRYKGRVKYVHCDVMSEADIAATMKAAEDTFGGLDILFNNAGSGGTNLELDVMDMDAYHQTMNLLVTSVVFGTKHAIPLMEKRGGGSIINTASVAAISAGFSPVIYAMAKGAVLHFSKVAAPELSKKKIRVNAVCPGFIATSIFGKSLGLSQEQSEQIAEMFAQEAGMMQPLGRIGEPVDIADAVCFLASEEAAFVTGTHLLVDGGITSGPPSAWIEDPEQPGIFETIGETMGVDIEALRRGT